MLVDCQRLTYTCTKRDECAITKGSCIPASDGKKHRMQLLHLLKRRKAFSTFFLHIFQLFFFYFPIFLLIFMIYICRVMPRCRSCIAGALHRTYEDAGIFWTQPGIGCSPASDAAFSKCKTQKSAGILICAMP